MGGNYRMIPVGKPTSPGDCEEAMMVLLAVDGMGCQNCATRIRNSLIRLDGVLEVYVYLSIQLAEVVFDPRSADPIYFIHAVSSAGGDDQHDYQARIIVRREDR